MAPPPAQGPEYDHGPWSSAPGPGYDNDPWSPGPVGRPARRALWRGLLAAAVVVLVLGAAGAGWFVFRGHGHAAGAGHGHKPAARASSPSPASSTPTSPTTSPSTSAASSSPPTSPPVSPSTSAPVSQPPAPAGSTPVALGPGVPQDGGSQRLDAFASRYFTAINQHDYQAYVALLGPNATIPTRGQFSAGYGSTSDSGATLTSTLGQGGGDWAIGLSFTSRQAASQSKTGTKCTEWQITLYLVPGGASYLEDSPPPGYHSSYRACP